MKVKKISMIVLLTALFAVHAIFAQAQFKVKEVVQTGDNAPVPSQLSSILEVDFNDQGQVALIGDGGLILKSGDQIIPVAGPADPVPDGGIFFFFDTPSLGPQGQVAFTAGGTFPGFSGVFLYANGRITHFLPDGIQADTGELVIPASARFARNGDMLITDSGSFFGVATYLLSNNTLTRVIGPGDLLPGGGTVSFLLGSTLNSSKQLVFQAVLSDGRQGMFLWSSGTISKIIASGDIMPDGVPFGFFNTPSINDLGQVVFSGVSNSFTDSGIFSYSNGRLSIVIPDVFLLSDGGSAQVGFTTSINNAGQIAFTGFTNPTFNQGVFRFANGQITTLALSGQPAPDGGIFTPSGQVGATINSSGQVLFIDSRLQHGAALYLFSNNQLSRVIGQGDTIPRQPRFEFPASAGVGAGDTVLISDSTFPGGIGAYTATPDHGAAPGITSLAVHVGEPIGVDGIVDFLFGFSMNHAGEVAAGVASSDARAALLLNDKSSLQVVADSSPGSAVDVDGARPAINDLGEIAFNGLAPATSTRGVFLNSDGETTLLLDAATPVPDGNGTLSSITNLALNSLDRLAFMAEPFPGPGGIFVAGAGVVTPLAIDGAPAPGGGNFLVFFGDPRLGPVIDDGGDVAFASLLTGTSGGFFGSAGIFLYRDGVVSRIAGPDDPSPDGGVFLFADSPSINSSGDIAFFAETSAFSFGAFVYSHGQISKVAISGEFIGDTRLGFVDRPVINNNGHVAFTSSRFGRGNAVFVAAPTGDSNPTIADWIEPIPGVPPDPERLKEIRTLNDQLQSRRSHNRSGQNVNIISQ